MAKTAGKSKEKSRQSGDDAQISSVRHPRIADQ
jgi:hypothetical protein